MKYSYNKVRSPFANNSLPGYFRNHFRLIIGILTLLVLVPIILLVFITHRLNIKSQNPKKDNTILLKVSADRKSDNSLLGQESLGNFIDTLPSPKITSYYKNRDTILSSTLSSEVTTYPEESKVTSSFRSQIREELQQTTPVKPFTNFIKEIGLNVWDGLRQTTLTSSIPSESTQVVIRYKRNSDVSIVRSYFTRIDSVDVSAKKIYGWIRNSNLPKTVKEDAIVNIARQIEPITRSGSILTEGDSISQSNNVRDTIVNGGYNQDGSGIKIGVISDGVDSLSDAVSTGELPNNVSVLRNYGGDEGTAMLEIIHDMVPGSQLYFASGFSTPTQFKNAVSSLISSGCKVIVDDIGYITEPFFEEIPGSIAKHVSDAIANNNIIYVSSAGNAARSHYQGQYFKDGATNYHDFSSGTSSTKGIYFRGNGRTASIVLEWNDTWGSSANNYDLHILTTNGNIAPGTSTWGKDIQNGDDEPMEVVQFPTVNGIDYEVVIENINGVAPIKTLEIYIYSVQTFTDNITPEDSIFGHPAVVNAVAVAAIDQAEPNNDAVESFSSRGPVTMINPSATRNKPDISGIDGVKVTGAGGFGSNCGNGFCRFYGTSASAPYVAAIMAHLWSEFPNKVSNEIRNTVLNTSVDIESPGYDLKGGNGRGNTLNAFNATASRPKATPSGGDYPTTTLITLTSRNATEIRYTSDGSDPLSTSSLYSGPFALGGTRTLKAKAFGTYSSDIMTEVYNNNTASPTPTPTRSTAPMEILFPLYIYPATNPASSYVWDDVALANGKVSITAIINPASGPGNPGVPGTDYTNGMNELQNSGVKMIGYVHTSYGSRDINTVKAEIEQWNTDFQPWVHGIFLDEAANDILQLGYYRDLFNYIKSSQHLTEVVLNFGVAPDEQYLTIADKIIIYEDFATNWANYVPSSYLTNYPNSKFAMIVHTQQSEVGMKSSIDLAYSRNIGNVFITDDIMDNPFDALPSYWTQEVDYIYGLNNQSSPTTTQTPTPSTTTPDATATPTATSTITQTPTRTMTPTLTPTSAPSACGSNCQEINDCDIGLLCDSNICKIPECVSINCACAVPTNTQVPTQTPVPTATPIPTATSRPTPTQTPSATPSPSLTPTMTLSPTNTRTPTPTRRPTFTPTATATNTPFRTPTALLILSTTVEPTKQSPTVIAENYLTITTQPMNQPINISTPGQPTNVISSQCDQSCGICGWRDSTGTCHTSGSVGNSAQTCCYRICIQESCTMVSGYGVDGCTNNNNCQNNPVVSPTIVMTNSSHIQEKPPVSGFNQWAIFLLIPLSIIIGAIVL